ncbi:FecR family protein [Mucilaginibacter terrae]|uniref:Transmembrane sensor n=1 Tax=Mucilaginibacter terrae TaxID=1955052 RepID=A0ABU3GPA5_9SPHI|nr:FecR domain-containing protein [Mucilaginibacter terrae]MDT3401440.1 transmembrane sensor [Mucilaginibacter terrae]
MELNNERFNYLLNRYINKECSADEFAEFFTYIENPAYDELMQERMKESLKTLTPGADVHQVDWDSIYSNIINHDNGSSRIRRMFSRKLAAAAAVVILCTAGLSWWLVNRGQPVQHVAKVTKVKDVQPGTDKAVLQLADGRRIVLNNTGNGVLAKQGSTSVKQQNGGVLAYDAGNQEEGANPSLTNTLSVPAGGKYMIILPDESKVWLNSNSSLTYAAAFTGAKREVVLKGEAYFEIAKDARHPFIVKSGRSTVQVLGTHFNISAYPDESLSEVTLCEGSVRLSVGNQFALLKPGDQASFNRHDDMIALKEVDVEEAIDWKNGYFQFDNAGIEKVMNKIKRWYNIDVAFQGAKPDVKFTGMISRNNKLSKILNLLQSTGGVDFEITDNKVIVKNK